ncbi:F-box/FBD/LRR-repeat protein At3g26920-like [Arabidopsis lyrata subsp. lyrata]|uniref:F-box/FBD/LRR-repeat protein At3g26920-like n=1 Tax=Arabidopsis lyrata subsp. lyrata TaxID=81972 RepID=UPI000A29A972|nr:F-box/FBD/LRR-repeat protein At3g26920-like [Arabidopsis lyrata subsp. lyrata]|eukprot:XP_020882518.1 F-box/FBD/LRR-repeat protein At3g26920-like [Arabidopsis lyrata subsp. lyrata]
MTMKRWKSCGQSFRNNDRISELPEALLLEILSLLPTKDVRATSVLSKRWRSLWKMVPRLEFDGRMFSDNISRCLLSHQAPVLQSLHLEMNSHVFSNMVIGILVGIAFGLHVRELVLYVYGSQELFRFPFSLCNCESLETLILGQNIIIDVPSPVCLNSLRTLDLDGVGYKDDESVLNLLSGCISLENLVVHRLEQADVKTFTIAVPSLQRLTLTAENDDEDSVYVINAPSLKYLKFDGVLDDTTCLIENTPELVEASLRDDDDDGYDEASYENILGSITSVKRLSLKLSPLEITFPTGSIFYQLAYLELYTFRTEWWNLLTLMFDTSPNLLVLKLTGFKIEWENVKNKGLWGRWNKPKNVPECLLLHLETFLWTCYEARVEDEIEVAKYILRNARRLKKATFSKIEIKPSKRVEMVEELKSVVRASNSCQLVFK